MGQASASPFAPQPAPLSQRESLSTLASLLQTLIPTQLGAANIGGRYDSTFGAIAEASYAHSLDDNWAAGLIGELGTNTHRLNATVGHQLGDGLQAKFTAEYLDQKLPTYKALLVGNNATTSGVDYYRPDGTTLIATATGGDLVGAAHLVASITLAGGTIWTGGTASFNNWTSASAAVNGTRGIGNSSTATYFSAVSSGCSFLSRLYCVSQ
jgi:hypothetical protein